MLQKPKKNDNVQPIVEVENDGKNDDVQPLVQVENDGSKKGENVEPQEYNVISSFTQFLMAPICAIDDLLNQDLF